MARWTRSRIWGETLASSLITRETVLMPDAGQGGHVADGRAGPAGRAEGGG